MQDIVERFLHKEEHVPLGPELSAPPPPPGTQPTLGPDQPGGAGAPPPMAPLNPFAPLKGHQSPLSMPGAPLPQDVYDVAYDVLNHRLVLSYEALAEGVTVDDVLVELLSTMPAPRITIRGEDLVAS